MVVKIRLARFGRANSPFYNIVVAHARYDDPLHHTPPFQTSPAARTKQGETRWTEDI